MAKIIDLTGQTFGELLVIKQNGKTSNGNAAWFCSCSCGNTTTVASHKLRSGHTKSCGHLFLEVGKANAKDLTDKRFGKLTARRTTKLRSNGRIVWECDCDCGNQKLVSSSKLISGEITQCGCENSAGEYLIRQILLENHIIFKQEYKFDDLIMIGKLRFDFAIFDNSDNLLYLIEYDGRQHFKDSGLWEPLEDIQKRDKMKNEYCLENGIPLIRIPYVEKQSITLENLIPFSSKFLM